MFGEHDLIARIRERAGSLPTWISLGIGDDAAVIEPERGAQIVVTTDSLVEDVHFKRAWTTLDAVGAKALAVNLSDLAAMGAAPRASLLSLAVPVSLTSAEVDALVDGFLSLARTWQVPLVGGNLTRSPGPLVVDVTVIGSVRPRRVLTRAGARAGDDLFVTGQLGAAAAGLTVLRSAADRARLDADACACVARYERPEPRLRQGLIAARRRSTRSAIDLSDGLADGVRQLAAASGLGAIVDAASVPVHAGAAAVATAAGADALSLALSGGEDYELLFAVPRRFRRNFLAAMRQAGDLPVTHIGTMQQDPGVVLRRNGILEPLPHGFVHF